MNLFYTDYYWKNGKPVGIRTDGLPLIYKIVHDPYFKHITIEKYHEKIFLGLVYDSQLLDFRKLKPELQMGWNHEKIDDHTFYLRDNNDRLILKEVHYFEQGVERSCELYSMHGFKISTHQMFYTHLGDSFSGVILYDSEKKPVMKKTYLSTPEGTFTDLLLEEWDQR